MMRLRPFLAATVVGALACVPAPSGAASATGDAPTYAVHSCRGPAGEPLSTTAFDGSQNGDHVTLSDACASGGSLEIALRPIPERAPGEAGSYSFFAPGGTSIAGYRAWLSSSVGRGDYEAGRIEDIFTADQQSALCQGTPDCTGTGDPTTPLSDSNLVTQLGTDRESLTLIASCTGACQPVNGPAAPAATLALHRSQLDLADSIAPTFTEAPHGPLLDPGSPRGGVLSAGFAAADVGGGLRDVVLEIDGAEAVRQPIAPDDANCREPFTQRVPCPLQASGTISFDTSTLAAGPHSFVLVVTDATGVNQARSGSMPVTTTGQPGSATAGPPVPAGLISLADSRVRRVRYDTLLSVPGTVRTAAGAPLPFAHVRVTSRPRVAGATAVDRPAVVADAAGRFTLRLHVRNSQTLTLNAGAASVRLQVRVSSRVTATADRRRIRNGDTLHLRGRLAGKEFQDEEGKLVEIQVKSATGWRTIDTATARRGRYRWSHRFRATTRETTYRFRALVRAEDGWPYETGVSKVLAVLVRP